MATASSRKGMCSLVKTGTVKLKMKASRTPYFDGIVVIEDKLLVIDDDACNLQLYNCHNGKLISTSHRLQFRPYGVCLISKTEVGVCLADCTIIILPLKSINDKKLVKTLNVRTGFYRCYSVELLNSDKLIVSGWKCDSMFCWDVVSVTDGFLASIHNICKGDIGCTHLAINKNTIYISCLTSDSITTGVYAYDIYNPNKQKFLYQHQELEEPGSIMADRDCVYVCDYDRIHQLTSSGQLVTIHSVSSSVNGIFYDDQHEVLYTTSYKSNVITVYKMEFLHQPVTKTYVGQTTTPKESMNHRLKVKRNWEPRKTDELVEKIFERVQGKMVDLRRALHQTGNFCVKMRFSKFKITKLSWTSKTEEEKQHLFSKFLNASTTSVSGLMSSDGKYTVHKDPNVAKKLNQRT